MFLKMANLYLQKEGLHIPIVFRKYQTVSFARMKSFFFFRYQTVHANNQLNENVCTGRVEDESGLNSFLEFGISRVERMIGIKWICFCLLAFYSVSTISASTAGKFETCQIPNNCRIGSVLQ